MRTVRLGSVGRIDEWPPLHVFRFIAVGIAKTLSKVFGLATMSFFGRMPSREDDKIALVAIVAIAWIPILVAMVVPEFAEMIAAGVALPSAPPYAP